jgi:hypothetical protein
MERAGVIEMSFTIPVMFNGRDFQPVTDVDIPPGTTAEATVSLQVSAGLPPPARTPESESLWQEIKDGWANQIPPWSTVDEAMAYTRGRPWF